MKCALAVASMFCAAILVAQSGTPQHAFTSDQIKWGPAPPFVPPGAQIAVLEGDPAASSGDFTIRFKIPNGYKDRERRSCRFTAGRRYSLTTLIRRMTQARSEIRLTSRS
jgi:hypothetical protein